MSEETEGGRPDESVTVVFSWRVNPGREDEFREWAHGITERAVRFPGHEGVVWLRPATQVRDYYAVLRFRDGPRLAAWLGSEERAAWREAANGIAVEIAAHRRPTGMETWFHLPATASPPRWKMVVVTFCAVYPLSVLLQWQVTPHLTQLPLLLRGVLFPLIIAPLLTYAVMPALGRLLRGWLYPLP